MLEPNAPFTIEIRRATGVHRIEPVVLALVARTAVRFLPWRRTLAIFDVLPVRQAAAPVTSIPHEGDFRGAGACLARSLARSQYLRRRGAESELVIGAATEQGGPDAPVKLDAHAWLEPIDDSPKHAVLHRIRR